MRQYTVAALRAACSSALLICSAVALSAQPAARAGQPPSKSIVTSSWTDPAIATVMLVNALDGLNARAVVIRRAGELPNNIILVTASTSATELAKAVSAMMQSRRNRGDRIMGEMRTTITAPLVRPSRPAGKPSRDERRASSDLKRLRHAPQFTIDGIGTGRAIVIRMADGSKGAKPATR